MEGSRLNPGQPIQLADIEGPLEPVVFPDGKQFDVQPYGPEQYATWRRIQKKWDVDAARRLLHYIVPKAKDEDFDLLSPRMMWVLLEHAQYKIDLVMYLLKKAEAEKAERQPPSPPSKPKIRKGTS